MTRERQDITSDFYQGDIKDIQITVYNQNGSLKDLDASEITYALFTEDPKTPELIFLKSSQTDTEIEVKGPGVCVVHLLPADTIFINGTFRHQLHVADAEYAGIVTSGRVFIFKSFARRPRQDNQTAYLTGAAP